MASHMGDSSRSTPIIGSSSNSDAPDQASCPVACVGSTLIETSIFEAPLECPSSPEMFTICSASHVDPETFPSIPEIGLILRFELDSERISVIL